MKITPIQFIAAINQAYNYGVMRFEKWEAISNIKEKYLPKVKRKKPTKKNLKNISVPLDLLPL